MCKAWVGLALKTKFEGKYEFESYAYYSLIYNIISLLKQVLFNI